MPIIDQYVEEMEHALHQLSRSAIRQVVDVVFEAWKRRSTIYLIGNGGSASTASHMMNDLAKFTYCEGKAPVRAVALSDNVPLITAFANDVAYDEIFAAQLKVFFTPQDVVIAISGSGNSPNILRACEYVQSRGGIVVGLCGSPGGRLAEIATHRVCVPAERIGQQEDLHLMIGHMLALALRERIERSTSNGTPEDPRMLEVIVGSA